jgi:TctA family transporter
MLMSEQPALFWGFVASMYVGNVALLILNLPLVGLFVSLLRIPYAYLYPAIIAFCVLGVYSVNQSVVDVWIMAAMGALGYVLRKFDFEVAPIVLGLVLSPMIEASLRQSLAMSNGSYAIFAQKPLAATMLAIAAVLLALGLVPLLRRKPGGWRAQAGLDEGPAA